MRKKCLNIAVVKREGEGGYYAVHFRFLCVGTEEKWPKICEQCFFTCAEILKNLAKEMLR